MLPPVGLQPGRKVFAYGAGKTVMVRDVATGEVHASFPGHDGSRLQRHL